ncbi:hypothetical protein SARC_08887 [Sphaeroforma arctica JP610]|uniref:Large ribosomal subunit protein mL49 n=1 Tax=Sphaeroforma arctica JP610 TaxID=667725 RepID=A0A0L0FRV9_9EUKA|nr:hypothetical protein SARC_08887 [Sphaeroforma arctica JP610]KNC78698.1 hypothetical protein SARC_08887 [Sphaeroforma arctica JP610]|eukprot:XP_014152600.1 hypothetical protein SARC_08887 [Sphaeroforma arctica JP610]
MYRLMSRIVRVQGNYRAMCTQAEPATSTVSGWFPPKGLTGDTYGYIIGRSRTNNVPIYEKIKQGGKAITEIRHVRGNVPKAVAEMRKVLKSDADTAAKGKGEIIKISSTFETVVVHNMLCKDKLLNWAQTKGF